MSKLWVIGEAPARGMDPSHPFTSKSGVRFAGLVGCRVDELSDRFVLRNLLAAWPGKDRGGKGDRWPASLARLTAIEVAPLMVGRSVLLMGKRVASAFRVRGDYLAWQLTDDGFHAAIFPHPSGVNRWWNDLGNVERAKQFLRGVP